MVTYSKQSYLSYLLRMWQVDAEDKPRWRASLESPRSGEQIGFSSLTELCHFLQQQAVIVSASKPDDKSPSRDSGSSQASREGGVDGVIDAK